MGKELDALRETKWDCSKPITATAKLPALFLPVGCPKHSAESSPNALCWGMRCPAASIVLGAYCRPPGIVEWVLQQHVDVGKHGEGGEANTAVVLGANFQICQCEVIWTLILQWIYAAVSSQLGIGKGINAKTLRKAAMDFVCSGLVTGCLFSYHEVSLI